MRLLQKCYCGRKKIAFTLAEVLITLSILGVVAAISIPSIINNYQKQATVSRLKIAYSIVDNLIQQSYIENGSFPSGPNMSVDNFDKYFSKYLNIAKNCGRNTSRKEHKADGCFKDNTFVNLDGVATTQGGYSPEYYNQVLLKNGMGVAALEATRWIVDIDGPNRGSSRLGEDIFMFNYAKSCNFSNPYAFDGNCNNSRESLLNRCKPNGTNQAWSPNGSGCLGLIMKDGWKISSDYPWGYAHKK